MPATNATSSTGPVPGAPRRRDIRRPDRTAAILSATYELLTEVGYDRLTIDAVAARARASKATIYHRWPGKRELVIEAFRRAGDAPLQRPALGVSLAVELTSFIEATRQVSGNDDANAFLSLLAAGQQDPIIAEALRDSLLEPRRACRLIVERAIERGEIALADPESGAQRVLEIVMGQVIVHNLILGAPIDDAFIRDLVDRLLLPLLRGSLDEDHQG